MNPDDIQTAAQRLISAEQTGQQTGLLSHAFPGMTMDDAYQVQAAVIAHHLALGRKQTGWKIGLTSRAMQQQLGIDTPDSGVLLDHMHFDHGATVPKGRFIAPRVEAEIAFIMAADLPADPTRDDVITATAHVAPSLEILDTRIIRSENGRARTITDTISDNAANGGIVLGPHRHLPTIHDLRWVGAIVTRDGVVEETGLGAGVLNDPVTGIIWLARRLATCKQRITAGQIILSGSFVRAIEAPPGSRFHADFGPFGTVSIKFD
jgi:2-oxo-hept-3-ene-1,7-dioate hydratase